MIPRALILLTVSAIAWVPSAHSENLFVASAARLSFCKPLLERLNKGILAKDTLALPGVEKVEFAPGKFTFQVTPQGPKLTERVGFALFDIDNDGRDEVLIKYLTSLRGSYGEILWVLKQSEGTPHFDALPEFPPEQFSRLKAVESMTPWPYKKRGLFLIEITPFTLNGINYLALKDILFGNRSFPDRTWVIAKYANRPLGPGGFGHDTDDFETVCSFKLRTNKK